MTGRPLRVILLAPLIVAGASIAAIGTAVAYLDHDAEVPSALLVIGTVVVLGLILFRAVRRHAVEPLHEIAREIARQTQGEDEVRVREDFEAEEHASLARALNVAADARSRARLQMERSQAELRLLGQITGIADRCDDFTDALRACCECICSELRWAGGHVLLVDADAPDRLIEADAWYLADAERLSRFVESTRRMPLRREVELPGRALANGEPVWVADCWETEWFERSPRREGEVRAAAAFPIWIAAKTVAVLEVFDTEPRELDFRMVAFMQSLGLAMGQVVRRKKSRETLLRRDRELEEAVRAASRATRSKSELLTRVSREIRDPMAAILGHAELLETAQKEDERLDSVAAIRRNGEHLLERIDELLDESKRA